MDPPPPGESFTEVEVRGEFGQAGGPARVVEGFVTRGWQRYAIRFMPTVRGEHTYHQHPGRRGGVGFRTVRGCTLAGGLVA